MKAPVDPALRLRQELIQAGRRLASLRLIGAREGNLSARLDAQTLLITPAGRRKAELRVSDLVRVSLDTEGALAGERLPPSSELPLHLAIYRTLPEALAVVHAHPPYVLALDRAGRGVEIVSPEADFPAGSQVPRIPFLPSGSEALAAATAQAFLQAHLPVAVLSGHGAVAWGADPQVAVDRLELLERSAQILILSGLAARG